jgi:hypothetical protein
MAMKIITVQDGLTQEQVKQDMPELQAAHEKALLSSSMTFKYQWFHIPTGETNTNIITKRSRLEFLELLNTWNRVGRDWKYWEIQQQIKSCT